MNNLTKVDRKQINRKIFRNQSGSLNHVNRTGKMATTGCTRGQPNACVIHWMWEQQVLSWRRPINSTMLTVPTPVEINNKKNVVPDYHLYIRRTKLCSNFASRLARMTEFYHWLRPRRGKCHRIFHNLRRSNNNLSTMPNRSGSFSSSPIIFCI